MIKTECIKVPERIIKEHDEWESTKLCDRCGNKIYDFDRYCSDIRMYEDTDCEGDEKYIYTKGFDLCDDCVENYLIPLLSKELNKEPNLYERVVTFDE